MENESPLSPNPTQESLDSDPSLQKKHQSMLDRLTHRHQSRLDTSLTRRSDSDPSPSFESTSAFLSRFSASKSSVDSQLSLSRRLPADDLKPHLDQISASISDLEKLVAENSYFLPSYELRSSLKTISDLRQTLENLSAELLPKKKFSFRNKSKSEPKPKEKEPEKEPEKPEFKVPASPGIWSKKGETLVRKFSGSEIGEFTISDLDSCEVRLMGSVRALFVHRLRNCRVYTGPVTGSVLIEGVEECVFVMASHQIRIHNAKKCDFYLRVRSRPIIEDSCGVRFAPYCLRYDGIEEELRETSLDEETENWGNVDDFLWLRAVQSPNWSVLPENERVGLVHFSSLEES
ncbi:PREDICTED: tubulin-folding cofactor C [Fragaria vesca subsp. vesca]|uniref:tubulin-folding cofactor C n=1 Tax=Fragaria vesca subsp. vesca TaxID=101020 RepID=UPI0002C343AC|nr:PREDICTED: tubulin-folding cofactor C [Fragaria vesca subsp. vesca]XP_011465491.1 PREDICTED: tubulin-folding cofactor C [Fragaria vesca subsp. vesca]